MFQKGNQEKTLLNVNQLIREVLELVSGEAQKKRAIAAIEISGRAVAVRPFFSAFPVTVKLADLSAGRVLCAIRVTCAGPGSPAVTRRTIVSVGARSA